MKIVSIVKTSLVLPGKLAQAAKATAASHGQTLPEFVADAVKEKIRANPANTGKKPWMRMAGALKEYAVELDKVDKVIQEEFERVNPDDWK